MVVDVDKETLALVLGALEAEAARRQRAATRAAGELDAEVRAGEITDKRRSAVRITELLVDANRLTEFGGKLRDAFAADTGEAPPPTPATDRVADDPELVAAAAAEASELHRQASALDETSPVDPIEITADESEVPE